MKLIRRLPIVTVTLLIGLTAMGQDDVAEIQSQKLQVDNDAHKTYFLIGPKKTEIEPDDGYKLLIILPGGDGSESFHPFIKRIYKYGVPDGYLVAQLVAVKWTPQQQIVWPHRDSRVSKMKFKTEEFVEGVAVEVQKEYKINPKHVFTLSWSSSGPAAYATSLQQKTSVTGSYVSMSVFKKEQLPSLSKAKGRAYYIEHSPDDKVCPFWMAEKAKEDLTRAKAKVELSQYDGGHGWHGNMYGRIRTAITWLEENTI